MEEEHWGEGFAKSLAVFLNGEAIPSPNARGERIFGEGI
jgi:isoamylase